MVKYGGLPLHVWMICDFSSVLKLWKTIAITHMEAHAFTISPCLTFALYALGYPYHSIENYSSWEH